jgi:hypothetical protein
MCLKDVTIHLESEELRLGMQVVATGWGRVGLGFLACSYQLCCIISCLVLGYKLLDEKYYFFTYLFIANTGV